MTAATVNGSRPSTADAIAAAQRAGLVGPTAIAAAIGVDKSTVSRVLNGTRSKPATRAKTSTQPVAKRATTTPAVVPVVVLAPKKDATLSVAIAVSALATGALSAITTRWVASAVFDGWTAWLAPVAIEGAALALARAIAAGVDAGRPARWMAWWLVAVALACNAAHVLDARPAALLVPVLSGFPASLAVLVLTLRATRGQT
ncbi:MAG: hypothetical protein RJA49_2774 [Actinomycetota bacterium]